MQISLCKQKILGFLLELSSQTYLSFWFTLQVKIIIHIFITKMHRCASMLALSSRNFQQIWPQKNIAVFQSWKKITSFPFFMPFAHFFLVALDWSEFPNHVCCAEHKSSFGFFFFWTSATASERQWKSTWANDWSSNDRCWNCWMCRPKQQLYRGRRQINWKGRLMGNESWKRN